jgi:hypothetical protein
MRKGPVPEKAIGLALPVARARGFVIPCRRSRESGIDLIIVSAGLTALICVCRTRQLNGTPEDLAAQFRIPLTMLMQVPPCPGRCREIWACDYYGSIRCFRLTTTRKACLAEIGRDGIPLAGTIAAQPPEGETIVSAHSGREERVMV